MFVLSPGIDVGLLLVGGTDCLVALLSSSLPFLEWLPSISTLRCVWVLYVS